MREETIVFLPGVIQMRHQVLLACPLTALEIMLRQSPQQQFALIEPPGMSRGAQDAHALTTAPPRWCVVSQMTGASVPDQVALAGLAEFIQHLFPYWHPMFVVVLVQAPTAPVTTMNQQRRRQVDGAVAHLLKIYSNSCRWICPRRSGCLGRQRSSACKLGFWSKQTTHWPWLARACTCW